MSSPAFHHSESQKIKQSFLTDGFVKIATGLPDALLDSVKADLSPYFGEGRVSPDGVPFADYNRVQDAWHFSKNVFAVTQCEAVLSALNNIYDFEMAPFQTLNFYRGTSQPVHADTIHFNSEPFAQMCGAWVALEDVGMDQGPLEYYPGSQNREEMNLDYFDIKVGEADSYARYTNEIRKIIETHGYQKEYGIMKKGEAIIWSANILHGGSPLLDVNTTRQSQVTHYYAKGVKYWRPQESVKAKRYFNPEWVVDTSQTPTKNPLKRALMISRGVYLRLRDKYQRIISN